MRGEKPETAQPAAEQHEHKGDSWEITLPRTRIHTLEQLLEHCEVDTRIWEVERFSCNKWEIGAKGDEGGIIVEPLFQVKAWLKRSKVKVELSALVEELKTFVSRHAPVYAPIHRAPRSSGNLLEISIADLHIGKLAWGKETGGADYDSKIAVKVHDEALEALVDRTAGFGVNEVLYVVGNDLLNADNIAQTTTRGTPQNSDSRYHKTFVSAFEMQVRAIERLRLVGKVKVLVVPGNHDKHASWHVGHSLMAWFRMCPDVEIDIEPLTRKYVQYGTVMLGFQHGDEGKPKDYPLDMAVESPKMWGDTKWREMHCGHLHTARMNEDHGIQVRWMPSLCAPDSWHSSNGYIGNIRRAEAMVWHREQGLIGAATYAVLE